MKVNTKWLQKLLKMEVPVQAVGTPQVEQTEVDATPVLKEYVPHWVELPEGKKVDINGDLNDITGVIHTIKASKNLKMHQLLNINLNSWNASMLELFKLWRRDSDNCKVLLNAYENIGKGYTCLDFYVVHDKLGIEVKVILWDDNMTYSWNTNTGLSAEELTQVIIACLLFKQTKEYQRYLRIKSLSDIRAEKLAKELDEQEKIKYRNAQTNRIRDYLENKNENQ